MHAADIASSQSHSSHLDAVHSISRRGAAVLGYPDGSWKRRAMGACPSITPGSLRSDGCSNGQQHHTQCKPFTSEHKGDGQEG
jgi:hypothetical protein